MDHEIIRPSKADRMAYHVDYAQDTVYSAHARLLQSKWREKRQYPRGRFGSLIETGFATGSRANYLTENVKALVTRELAAAAHTGAFLSAPRIWDNLLESQTLAFNLFGEMQGDLDLATAFFRALFPDRVESVTSLKFEYSPGRRDEKYTGDLSAFDVCVETLNQGKRGCIGIDVKYAESLNEENAEKAARKYTPRHAELARESGVYRPEALEELKRPPAAQIVREHALLLAARQDHDEGFLVFLHPAGNKLAAQAVATYQGLLVSGDESATGFYPRHLETFIDTLIGLRDEKWTHELKERYLGA
jgi:hypothetical protein